PPTAGLLIVATANLLVGLAVTVGVLAVDGPAVGSLALGAATALTGMVFAAIALVTAQLTEHSGTASGLALGALALAFMVRGVGDVIERQGSWLSWFSPFAWAQQTRVYVDLRWWPLTVSLAVIVAGLVIAVAIGLSLSATAFGALASSLDDMVADMPAVSEWAPIDLDDLTTSFAAFVLMMLALGPIGLVVAGVLRLRTEEQEGRLAGAL